MGRPRFHVSALRPGILRLPDHEASHASRSRRLAAGAPVMLFDGRGHEAEATIVTADRNEVAVDVGHVVLRARPTPALTLAFAPPKAPRQDLLIEKCTELCVAAIQPIASERAVAAASAHRREKWRRKAIEAAKQSGQCWLPELCEPKPLTSLLGELTRFDQALLAVAPDAEAGPAAAASSPIVDLLESLRSRATLLGLVGPEGGWTAEELEAALAAGAVLVTLGPNVLRVETAALALAALLHGIAQASEAE